MTDMTRIRTSSKFEASGSYARAVAVDDWIFVSNTAGRDPQTQTIPEDAIEQTRIVLATIERALVAAGSSLADIVVYRAYIQNPSDVPGVMELMGATFRGIDPAATITCPPLGSSVYKVEIEATARRGASTFARRDIKI